MEAAELELPVARGPGRENSGGDPRSAPERNPQRGRAQLQLCGIARLEGGDDLAERIQPALWWCWVLGGRGWTVALLRPHRFLRTQHLNVITSKAPEHEGRIVAAEAR